MIASDANDVWISVIGMAAVLGAAIIAGWFQNRRTRQMNTAEHERSADERRENREAVLFAIELVHGEVKDVKSDVGTIKSEQQVIKGDLQAHLGDELAHRRHSA